MIGIGELFRTYQTVKNTYSANNDIKIFIVYCLLWHIAEVHDVTLMCIISNDLWPRQLV